MVARLVAHRDKTGDVDIQTLSYSNRVNRAYGIEIRERKPLQYVDCGGWDAGTLLLQAK